MSNDHGIKGSCLCGAVTLSTTSINKHIAACHCSMCRKWGGGPFLGAECESEISFSGQENIESYQSSEWAERGFCKNLLLKNQLFAIVKNTCWEKVMILTF